MISLSLLREELELPATKDRKVARLRAAVIALWESQTRKYWNFRTGEVKHYVNIGANDIWIPAVNVDNLALEGWGQSETEADAEQLEDDDYIYEQMGFAGCNVSSGYYWPYHLKATFDCGYEELPEELADITEALILQVKFQFKRTGDEILALESQNFEGGSTKFMKATYHPIFAEAVSRHKWKL